MIVVILFFEWLFLLLFEVVFGVELCDGVVELGMGLVFFVMGFGMCMGCLEVVEVVIRVLEVCVLLDKVVGRVIIVIFFLFGVEVEIIGIGVGWRVSILEDGVEFEMGFDVVGCCKVGVSVEVVEVEGVVGVVVDVE